MKRTALILSLLGFMAASASAQRGQPNYPGGGPWAPRGGPGPPPAPLTFPPMNPFRGAGAAIRGYLPPALGGTRGVTPGRGGPVVEAVPARGATATPPPTGRGGGDTGGRGTPPGGPGGGATPPEGGRGGDPILAMPPRVPGTPSRCPIAGCGGTLSKDVRYRHEPDVNAKTSDQLQGNPGRLKAYGTCDNAACGSTRRMDDKPVIEGAQSPRDRSVERQMVRDRAERAGAGVDRRRVDGRWDDSGQAPQAGRVQAADSGRSRGAHLAREDARRQEAAKRAGVGESAATGDVLLLPAQSESGRGGGTGGASQGRGRGP